MPQVMEMQVGNGQGAASVREGFGKRGFVNGEDAPVLGLC